MKLSLIATAFLLTSACSEKTVSVFNDTPTAYILSPSAEASFNEGETVRMLGQGEDSNDGAETLEARWTVDGTEVCSGPLDTEGMSTCDADFRPGEPEVVLTITDPKGAAGIARLNLSILSTDAPTVNIESPSEGEVFREGDLIRFAGTIVDDEDAPDALVVVWSSSLSDEIILDTTLSTAGFTEDFGVLDVGEHAITLKATDTSGKLGTDSVIILVRPPNEAPTCAVLTPEAGSLAELGVSLNLTGIVGDDDPVDALTVDWSSDVDGPLSSSTPNSDGGVSYTTASLSSGPHTISLTVQDADGLVCVADTTVTIGAPPTITMASPVLGGRYYADQLIMFSGVAEDSEDASELLTVEWTTDSGADLSAIDTTVASDGGFTGFGMLDEGEHGLTVRATDTTGLTSEASVIIAVGAPNSAPACSIDSPPSETRFGATETIIFEATATDIDVPSDLLMVGWESNIDGPMGSSTPTTAGDVLFTASGMSPGTHVVSMTVTDEIGATCVDNLLIDIGGPPTVVILAPVDGAVFNEGETIDLAAHVVDDEDPALSLVLSWSSSVDGILSTAPADPAGSVAAAISTLSIGDHTIALSATDTHALVGTDAVDIRINGLPSAPTVEISPDPAITDDDIEAVIVSPSTDPEGDGITYQYQWQVDGIATAHTAAIVPAADTESGQVWTVTVTPADMYGEGPSATDDVIIGNATPIMDAVSLSPIPAFTNDTITATVAAHDLDGDALTYTYEWTVSGVVVAESSASLNGAEMGGFQKDDTVMVTVAASDADGTSAPLSSAILSVSNTPPTAPTISVGPPPIEELKVLQCSVDLDGTDEDGDPLSYAVDWTVDGLVFVGSTTTIHAGDTLPLGATSPEEVWVCTVTPNDGDDDGSEASVTVTIAEDCDRDGDGYDAEHASCGGDDCNDADPDIHPGAVEIWYDGIDTDCDGESDYDADSDGHDHIDWGGDDCLDTDPSTIDCSDGVADYLPSAESPLPVTGHSLETDAGNDRLVLFGGQTHHQLSEQLLSYALIDDEWTSIGASGVAPDPRRGHASAMDADAGMMYVFGGQGYHTLSDELFVLDTSSGAEHWTLLSPTGRPPPLTDASLVMTPSGQLYLFGGQGYHGLSDEVWVYDIAANTWSGSTFSSGPIVRSAVAAWDTESEQAIVFSGQTYHDLNRDGFCYDGSGFTPLSVIEGVLPVLTGAASASADAYGGIVVFGGSGFHRLSRDTLLVTFEGGCSVKVLTLEEGDVPPAAVTGAAMAWSVADSEAFVVGGQGYHMLETASFGISP